MSAVLPSSSRRTPKHARAAALKVIVADHHRECRRWLQSALQHWGFQVEYVESMDSLISSVVRSPEAVVLLDASFGASGGLSAFRSLMQEGLVPAMIFGANKDQMNLAVSAIKLGARDFVEKNSSLPGLRRVLMDAALPLDPAFCRGTVQLVGNSSVMRELRALIRDVAASDATVMIIGESGTGKELVARAVHDCSERCEEEFVPVNMAALPENLVESVLFGHEKGSFTGAETRQVGLCQQADKGTLFLDEISEMQKDLQPKLLRFLQEYTYQRVGSTRTERADVRIISATNRIPQELISSGAFREDLYYRLNVVPIHVPALRERKEDIPLLARTFAARAAKRKGCQVQFSDCLLNRLMDCDWPGNVRQLQNLVERMVILAKGDELTADHLPRDYCLANPSAMPANRRLTRQADDQHAAAADAADANSEESPQSSEEQSDAYQQKTTVLENSPAVSDDGDVAESVHNQGHSGTRLSFATMELDPVLVGDRYLTRMELIERMSIIDALVEYDGNVTAAARFLGLGPATVYRKIRSFGITGFTNSRTGSSSESDE